MALRETLPLQPGDWSSLNEYLMSLSGVPPIGVTPITNGAMIWDGSQFRADAKIKDINVDAAAAIAYSKLNLAASIARSDMAAGFKTTVGTLAAGPPGSPTTNDIWIATDVDANGTDWMFRYNSAEATYKWEFIGGGALSASVQAGESPGSTGAWVDLATVGPSVTVARAGDYEVTFGARCNNSTAVAGQMYIGVKPGTAAIGPIQATAGLPANTNGDIERTLDGQYSSDLNGIAAASVLKMQYFCTTTTAATYSDREIRVRPRRVI